MGCTKENTLKSPNEDKALWIQPVIPHKETCIVPIPGLYLHPQKWFGNITAKQKGGKSKY